MATTSGSARRGIRARRRGGAAARYPLLTATTFAAVGGVLAWFAVQLGQFVGEAPDFDAMISLRESIVFHRDGLKGLIADRVGTGVHPPLMDTLTSLFFSVFGEDPRSQQLIGIVLFAVLAAAVERLLAPWLSAGYRVLAALAVAMTPSLAIVHVHGLARGAGARAAGGHAGDRARARGADAAGGWRCSGRFCALFPLTKDACLVLVGPFALYAFFTGGRRCADRVRRGRDRARAADRASILWRIVLKLEGGDAWHTWITSERADEGPFVVALRAMFGMERGLEPAPEPRQRADPQLALGAGAAGAGDASCSCGSGAPARGSARSR